MLKLFLIYVGLCFTCVLLCVWYYIRRPVYTNRKADLSKYPFKTGDLILFRAPTKPVAIFTWWYHVGVIVEVGGELKIAEFMGAKRKGQRAGLVLKDARRRMSRYLERGHILAVRAIKHAPSWTDEETRSLLDAYHAKEFDHDYQTTWLRTNFLGDIDHERMSCSGFVGAFLAQCGVPVGSLNRLSPGQFSSAYSSRWDAYFSKEVYLY
jgi:hypothetical protein